MRLETQLKTFLFDYSRFYLIPSWWNTKKTIN